MTAPDTAADAARDSADLDVDGAGVLSSWADLVEAATAERWDPNRFTFAAAAAGLDTLGAVLHPFDALVEAGFGWLLEHVWFLREPLDALAGDPGAVLAQARSWDHVAGELRAAGTGYRAAAVPGWEGPAAAGYRHAGAELAAALDTAADQAGTLSRLVLATGAAVGTVRSWIRDTIAGFASTVVQYLLAAGVLAVVSAGGSVGGFVLTVVFRALELAERIAQQVRRLLDALAAASGVAGRLGTALQRTDAQLRAAAPGLHAAGEAAHRGAESVGAPTLIEAGKQLTDANADLHTRPGTPVPPTESAPR